MTGARMTPLEMTGKLIGFDTTSRNSNLPLIDFVRDYLDGHGVGSILVPTEDGRKAALYATIGPADRGGVVLSGHTDVVPVDGQAWDSDPFDAVERDGRLYGRGACDMKGFIATALAMVPDFKAAGLKKPIHLALSYDEEVGCIGVEPMISHVVENLPRPELVIIGEPTSMRVVNAHKGINHYHTEVTGHEAHSSATHIGVNAIAYAARAITELDAIAEDCKTRGDGTGRFTPPYTTVHVGTIEGGTALNIVPRHCAFHWEFRSLPGEDLARIPERYKGYLKSLEPEMKAISEAAGFNTVKITVVPEFAPQDGSPAENLALKLARQNDTHTVSFGTEAGHFQKAGIPAIVCGPGNIEQAHKPNEYIDLTELENCAGFIKRLVKHLSE